MAEHALVYPYAHNCNHQSDRQSLASAIVELSLEMIITQSKLDVLDL
jgi:hypothetical protein